jgi:exo-beta-1,3-glucanase (GH17 family)
MKYPRILSTLFPSQRSIRVLVTAAALTSVLIAARPALAVDCTFFDDHTVALKATAVSLPDAPTGTVPVFVTADDEDLAQCVGDSLPNGMRRVDDPGTTGEDLFNIIEINDQVPDSSSFPTTWADIIANGFLRLAYQGPGGPPVNFGTSVVGSPSFRLGPSGDFRFVPTVTRAEVTANGVNRLQITLTASFDGLATVTSTRSFPDPVIGKTITGLEVEFRTLDTISLASGPLALGNDAFRLVTASSMFSTRSVYDASVLRYESADREIRTFRLTEDTPRDNHLFDSGPVDVGSWFELVKEPGSTHFPDSPTIRVQIDDLQMDGSTFAGRVGLQGFLAADLASSADSLSVWLEWVDVPNPIPANTMLSTRFTVSARPPAAVTDHFVSYQVKKNNDGVKFRKFGPVRLADRFREAHYAIGKPRALLLPTNPTEDGVFDGVTHLMEYPIKATKGTPKFRPITDIRIVDQCSDIFLEVRKPKSLLVPTNKSLTGPVGAPEITDHAMDHFLCYRVRRQKKHSDGTKLPKRPKGTQVVVADQFQTRRYDLKKIRTFCVPVAMDEAPGMPSTILAGPQKGTLFPIQPVAIRNPDSHVVCCQAKAASKTIPQAGCGCDTAADPKCAGVKLDVKQPKHAPKKGIHANNQFRPELLDTVGAVELCAPSSEGKGFDEKLRTLTWLAYAPTNFDPTRGCPAGFPDAASIRADLEQAHALGFTGLITFAADCTLGQVPGIAREVGFEGVIMGLFLFSEALRTEEMQNAIAAADDTDGYGVGNEGLIGCGGTLYTPERLVETMEELRAATGKPVTTSEQIEDYLGGGCLNGFLLANGDWLFPITHPFNNGIRDPAAGAEFTEDRFAQLSNLTSKSVFFKETGWPTGGDPAATEENQEAYFTRLRGGPVRYAYFEAFDQPWKPVDPPWERFWGLFRSDRSPKRFLSAP